MSDSNDGATPDDGGMPDLGGLLSGLTGGGGGGLGDLFAQASQAMSASQSVSAQEIEGTAGGGMVKIRATGGGEVLDISIDPSVVDPDDVAALEDLILAATRDVQTRIGELHAQAMGGFDPSAMLGGLFGSDEEEEGGGAGLAGLLGAGASGFESADDDWAGDDESE